MRLNLQLYNQLIEQGSKIHACVRQWISETRLQIAARECLMRSFLTRMIPIHRHPTTSETIIVLYGCLDEMYYDNDGNEIARYMLCVGEGLQIDK